MTSNTLTSSSYNHGNQIRIQGKLKKLLPAQNPGQFDERSYYREQNIFYKIEEQNRFCISNTKNSLKVTLFSFKQHMKKIYRKYLNPKDSGVVTAMLLGDRSALDSEIKELYQQNGNRTYSCNQRTTYFYLIYGFIPAFPKTLSATSDSVLPDCILFILIWYHDRFFCFDKQSDHYDVHVSFGKGDWSKL